jgi:hypothetical protein
VSLAADADRDVRYAVARNPNTPPATLAALARDDDASVRKEASARLAPSSPANGETIVATGS